MGTKDRLLALLEADRRDYLSGEQAAAQLGVSRAAVWKAVEALRTDGHGIESAPGRGYRLAADSDLLTPQALEAWLGTSGTPVRVYDEVDSTNLVAKRWAMEGAPHGSLVVAQRQTAGRGRLGRAFASPPGGLYLSVVLRPQRDFSGPGLVTSAAAVAACRAVARLCGIQLGIKWVNDLYLDGKKCCGILTEAGTDMESGTIEYMVTGIGINHSTPAGAFSPEVEAVATSLYPHGGAAVGRAQLAAAVQGQLLALFDKLPDRDFLEEYRRRSIVLGCPVTVMDRPPYPATAVAIDDEAQLVVRTEFGVERVISWGEISVKPDLAHQPSPGKIQENEE